MTEVVLSKSEGNGVVRISVNRPDALNALNHEVLKQLSAKLEEAGADPELRCVILSGEGGKAFVAGADIKEMSELDADGAREYVALGQGVMSQLEDLRVPVIAEVGGFALVLHWVHS